MNFFVPHADTPQLAREVYEAIKAFSEQNLGTVSNRKIFRIEFRDRGKDCVAQVGMVTSINGEEVMAILEQTNKYYLVCTYNRGVVKGLPMLVGTNEVWSVEDFEG